MNSQNLTNPDKEIYQQPVLKVITVQASRSILKASDPTEINRFSDEME